MFCNFERAVFLNNYDSEMQLPLRPKQLINLSAPEALTLYYLEEVAPPYFGAEKNQTQIYLNTQLFLHV